ncbi:MAG TPA: hypothetical protein VNC50_06365, partial [Planctomycetia bacterium]|nr:hypothetical protein [Planctomycetia bacterium]
MKQIALFLAPIRPVLPALVLAMFGFVLLALPNRRRYRFAALAAGFTAAAIAAGSLVTLEPNPRATSHEIAYDAWSRLIVVGVVVLAPLLLLPLVRDVAGHGSTAAGSVLFGLGGIAIAAAGSAVATTVMGLFAGILGLFGLATTARDELEEDDVRALRRGLRYALMSLFAAATLATGLGLMIWTGDLGEWSGLAERLAQSGQTATPLLFAELLIVAGLLAPAGFPPTHGWSLPAQGGGAAGNSLGLTVIGGLLAAVGIGRAALGPAALVGGPSPVARPLEILLWTFAVAGLLYSAYAAARSRRIGELLAAIHLA